MNEDALAAWRAKRLAELQTSASAQVGAVEVDPTRLQELARANPLVLLDVWAEWCGPCRMMEPIVDELAAEWAGKAVVAKLDADQHPDFLAEQGIMGIPTFLFFQGGKVAARLVGARPKRDFRETLERLSAGPT